MFCFKCGAEISDESDFCMKCGTEILHHNKTEIEEVNSISTIPMNATIKSAFVSTIIVSETEISYKSGLKSETIKVSDISDIRYTAGTPSENGRLFITANGKSYNVMFFFNNNKKIAELCGYFSALSNNTFIPMEVTTSTSSQTGETQHEEKTLSKRMEKDSYFVRVYAKNQMYTGKHIATKLWVGDYTTGDTFEKFAQKAEGIKRIGVLRADVDNLGQTFVAGFAGKYATLSRTAALSRQLSIFFKYYIRSILKNGEYHIDGEKKLTERNATIVYSGGDDVFIVGAWNEVIELSIDLQDKFKKYTQGTLSISSGIGIYECTYPIGAIANETGEMEAESKRMPEKDSVTFMDDGETHLINELEICDGTYRWEELYKSVLGEKYDVIQDFLGESDERGMSFLYRMLELIRNQKEKINFARFVYLLSRLEPDKEGEKKEKYRKFSRKMYQWVQSEKDCRELKTAINLYAYMHREKGAH